MLSRSSPARLLVAAMSLVAVTLATASSGTARATPATRPSIVVINTDDQRFDALASCLPPPGLGRPSPLSTCPMPSVRDDLIAHGVTFKESFVTTALCCPSRASLFTGNYAHTTGVLTNEKPTGGFSAFRNLQGSTIATWLHDGGYRTGLFGKYLNQYTACPSPPCTMPPGWDSWHAEVTDGDVDYTDFQLNDDGAINSYPAPQYSTTVLGRKAVDFIGAAPAGQPLFVYFAPFAPHPPAVAASADQHAYDSMPNWRPPSWNTVEPDKPQWVRDTTSPSPTGISNKDAEHRSEMASLLEVDRQVHAIVTALGARASNTLFVFTTDNGISWGEHRYFDKKNCEYEECHRVPLVVRYDPLTDPAGTGPARIDAVHPVLNVDLASTVAEAAGLMDAAGMDGRSFLPLLSAAPGDDPPDWRAEVLGEDYGSLVRTGVPVPTLSMVRTFPGDALPGAGGHSWKYVALCVQSDGSVPCSPVEHELYDETADPYEQDNRSGDPGLSGLEAALDTRLSAIRSTAPPAVTFTSGPPPATNQTSWNIAFQSAGASRFWCSLDGSARAPCASPFATGPLSEGTHTLDVVADGTAVGAGVSGTSAPASRTWRVDTTKPDTSITAGPVGTVTATSATFSFSSSESGSSTGCSLDGAAYTACTSPTDLSGLAQGGHTFSVRATDPAGNTDPTPGSRAWTVDSVPETTITAGPPDGSLLRATSTTFRFGADVAGSTFECSLDGGAYEPCTTPEDLTGLDQGPHAFSVRALNAGFTDPTPESRSFTVDTVGPETTITDGPAAAINSTGPYDLRFTSSEPGSSFVCRVDGSAWATCTSPRSVSVAGEGQHEFSARATDPAGNLDSSAALWSWTVDTTAPDTTIGSGPSGTVASTDASFSFSSPEDGASFACSLDGGAFSGCTSPRAYHTLPQGGHTFSVRATDPAGNTDPTPGSRAWTVDTVAPPDPAITDTPSDPSGPSASFKFTDTEPGVAFRCALDAAPAAPCSSPATYSGLSAGGHTFSVIAMDGVGNGSGAASHGWQVRPPPSIDSFSGPPAATNDATVSFTFTASDTEATFTCSLDDRTAEACASPHSVTVSDGHHTLVVVATNVAGSSAPHASSWSTDTAPPSVTLSGPAADAFLTETSAKVKWTSSDPAPSSGSLSFTLEERREPDGEFAPAGTTPAKSLTRTGLDEGTTYCWRVTATDPAGNQGTTAERCAGVPLDDRALTSTGPVLLESSATAFDGTLSTLQVTGTEIDYSFTGRKVGLMLERGPALGKARVFLDDGVRKYVDLYAATPTHRRYVWTRAFPASGTHTVRVVFSGAHNALSSGTDVPVDAVTSIASLPPPPPPPPPSGQSSGRFRW
jgi:arylsulfatase A-like enzyme